MSYINKVLDSDSLSYEEILSNIIEYEKAVPEKSRWVDFYESSSATVLNQVIAGLGTLLSHQSVFTRTESYIETAVLYPTHLYLAGMLGYPVNRLSAPRLSLKVLNQNPHVQTWSRFIEDGGEYISNSIATYGDYDISIVSTDVFLEFNKETIFEAVIGNWKQKIIEISDSDTDFLRVFIEDSGIDNNKNLLELFVNDRRMNLVDYTDDAIITSYSENNDSVIIKTHYNGVILIFGDGIVGKKLYKNDVIKFNYIQSEGRIGVLNIDPSEISMNIGQVTSSILITPGYEPDQMEKIKTVAPGFHASAGRMVNPSDHINILLGYAGDLISANLDREESSCCTTRLSYLFRDEHIISSTEEEAILEYLNDYKMVGMEIQLIDPIMVGLDLKATIVLNEGVDLLIIKDVIKGIITSKTMKLGELFHLGDLTRDINNLDEVYRIYVERPLSDRQLKYNEYLKLIDINLNNITFTYDKTRNIQITPGATGYIDAI